MKTLEKEITVSENDLDDLNHVNNVVYIKWVQEIAKNHWKSLVSSEVFKNYYWVLLEHQIKYLSPA
ncbi:MAG: thioesterase, partial [Flavobacteriaceae bacterium]|nr:thioesterase [Flavobacteriaceae bacterium]